MRAQAEKWIGWLVRHLPWLPQFVCFGCVGVAGLAADAGVLALMLHGLGMDAYSGRMLSYIAAATVTWALNRRFTFRAVLDKEQGGGDLFRQWLKFLLANLSGFAANYGTYVLCINLVPVMREYKLLALIPASIVGLVFNFTASKRLVFK